MKLWHSKDTRSLRPLWAMEELGVDYELEVLPFPPRVLQKSFLESNELGTVPYFTDGEISMTESPAICHYLGQKHDRLVLNYDHREYGDFLNWLYQSDATLTFPQAIYVRYAHMEPEERKLPQAAEDYRVWFLARLRRLNRHIKDREFLNDDRFTMADICVGYALYLGKLNRFDSEYEPQTIAYLERLMARDAFQRAVAIS